MYLEIDEDFPAHPKSMRLGIILGNPVAWAYVQKLWIFACKYQKDGDLSAYSPEEIEGFVGWSAADGRFYAAVVKVGFIDEHQDGGRSLHNWAERQGKWLEKMEADRRRKADGRAAVQRTSIGQSTDTPPPVHRTDPVPDQTRPDLTQPNPTKIVDPVTGPRTSSELIRLFELKWTKRWNLPFRQAQWDQKTADALMRSANPGEIGPALDGYLRCDDQKYLDKKHPFTAFERDFDRFRDAKPLPPPRDESRILQPLPRTDPQARAKARAATEAAAAQQTAAGET